MNFNEAAASATIRCNLRGYDLMFTLWEESGAELLKKVQAALDALEKAGAQPNGYSRVVKSDTDGEVEEAPICEVHGTPMVRRQGKNGPFWSCPQRLPDGSWCSYRPQKA